MFRFSSQPILQTLSSFKRLWRSRYTVDPTVEDRLGVLYDQSDTLSHRIDSLEEFITSAPKLAREYRLHSMNTVPAPDELTSSPDLRLSRQQMVALKRNRYRQLFHFVLLFAGLMGVIAWLGYQLTAGESVLIYYSNL